MLRRNAIPISEEILEDFPCLGIVGPRQIGKTTLAHQISKNIDRECIYLDLESIEDAQKLSDPEAYLRNFENQLVIIDEVQRQKNLFPVLRSLIDRNRVPGRFILLGSASPELIRDSSETLAGRIAYLELEGISCSEFGWEKQDELWIKGGYPEPLLNVKNRFRWFENYLRTYLERDLPLLGLPANPTLSRKLMRMLSHIQGSTINYSNLSKSLEINYKTAQSYIDFLESAFLIRQLPSYSTNMKKRLVKAPKIYFRDSGLFHFFHSIETYTDLINHPMMGVSWEGFVIEQISSELIPPYEMYFYRTHHGAEVDLVISDGITPLASIEIKHGDTILPSFGNESAANDLGAKHRILIHSKSESKAWKNKNGWEICSLKYFIEEILPRITK